MIRRPDPRVRTLSTMGIFAGAAGRELQKACGLMTEVRLPAGSILCAQGDDPHEVFLLVQGEVAVSRDGMPLGVEGAGSIIGELSVLDGRRRTATAVAMTDVVTLVMTLAEFARLLELVPIAAHNLKALRITRTQEIVALRAA